jgi:MOSC domain-containing protein YiiM
VLTMLVRNLSLVELEKGLPDILQSPRDAGVLKMIVQRPAVGERRTVAEGTLSLEEGLVGDNWSHRRNARRDMQLTLMNSRVAALVAQQLDRWSLAGDQLYVDLDLSLDNLPAGSRLRVGNAVIAVTAVPHRGCSKFVARFGKGAREFVNSDVGCRLNLRGINARIAAGGVVKVGDAVIVESRGAE